MVYESDTRVLAWFETALGTSERSVRRRAVWLLRLVDCPRRQVWLEAAAADPDSSVSDLARSILNERPQPQVLADEDLYESDFATGMNARDLEWEWEYEFVVVHGLYVPTSGPTRVWVKGEDDAQARELAVMRACARGRDAETAVPILVGKRFVNRYTRSPRSTVEALRWIKAGRPGYSEPDG